MEIVDLSARKFLAGLISKSPSNPKVRIDFRASGIDVHVKYFSSARKLY